MARGQPESPPAAAGTVGGALSIALAMAVWSSWGVALRELPLPAYAVTFWVSAVAAGVAGAAWAVLRPPAPAFPRGVFAVGAMGVLFLLNQWTFFAAYQRTTMAGAVLTHYIAPVLVAVTAPLVLRERPVPGLPLAVGAAAAGLVLLLPWGRAGGGDASLLGLALGAASGVFYAGLILVAGAVTLRAHPIPIIAVQHLVVAVLLGPWALRVTPTAHDAGILLFLGLVHGAGAGLLYLGGIRRTGAQIAALLGYLEPVGAVAWGWVLFGEALAPRGWLGGLLILSSGLWAATRRFR